MLANHYKSWDAFSLAMREAGKRLGSAWDDLNNIDGVGAVMATALVDTFNAVSNRGVIERLLHELDVQDIATPDTNNSSVVGKTIVFTGTLIKMTRSEAKARAESLGCKVTGSVSAKTDFLVAGQGAGRKAKQAESLGVKIISEDDWFSLVNA